MVLWKVSLKWGSEQYPDVENDMVLRIVARDAETAIAEAKGYCHRGFDCDGRFTKAAVVQIWGCERSCTIDVIADVPEPPPKRGKKK